VLGAAGSAPVQAEPSGGGKANVLGNVSVGKGGLRSDDMSVSKENGNDVGDLLDCVGSIKSSDKFRRGSCRTLCSVVGAVAGVRRGGYRPSRRASLELATFSVGCIRC
jgi:hypothetical protein